MNINKIKRKLREELSTSLDYDLYANLSVSREHDDVEIEIYDDMKQEIISSYDDAFDYIEKSDVVELVDDKLKQEIYDFNKNKRKILKNACECLSVENMLLYNLVCGGEVEKLNDCRIAHVFCKCDAYLGYISYNTDED